MESGSNSHKLAVVTGGAGFIGSHLCERLVKEGWRVISLDNYFTGSKENHVEGVEYREGHTKDIEKLIPETPDIIYHLGEYSRVEISFNEPALVWDLNSVGTAAVLEFARLKKVKIIYAGSSTKFGDGGLGRTQSPYAWSKASNTELVKNYGEWYGVPHAIAYFYNVYGPRERAGKYGTLIQTFIEKVKRGEKLTVVSPGTQVRNFTHVHDIVSGLILIGEQGEGDDFGIGNDKAYSILEVAQLFGKEIEMLPPRAGNRMDSSIDTSKLRALGWAPKHSLEDYLQDALK
jgi:UDP-glucose 4-epimerase